MPPFEYPFTFIEEPTYQIKGNLELDEPLPYRTFSQGSGFYRPGRIQLEDGTGLDLVLYHNDATASFMYLRNGKVDLKLLDIIGMPVEDTRNIQSLHLPGQLCMGSDRSNLIGTAIRDIVSSPVFQSMTADLVQQNMAVFPIAREGLKYQVSEALYEIFGYYVDEILLDAHHVFDSSVPVYNRKVELGLFKDKDLEKSQRENITVAFIADSIASGLVMKEVISRIKERFCNLQQVEVVSPLATIRGLCRLAHSDVAQNTRLRVHVFETLLNALAPDYYYSAHFNIPELHIRPDLDQNYRNWWGVDAKGRNIADTACAGYGWSEVFYSPRKQIQMMNNELMLRHNLKITDIIRRNIV
jgi:hypothetical protein